MTTDFNLDVEDWAEVSEHYWFLSGSVHSDGLMRHIPINETPFSVGRYPKAELILLDRSISKIHAQLVAAGNRLFLRDLDSRNGTFVNGRRIFEDTVVDAGDLIQFANLEFRVGKEDGVDTNRTMEIDRVEGGWMQSQFETFLHDRQVTPHFQPIIALANRATVGYEALARSSTPGLNTPREMFKIALQLNSEARLSELCRDRGIEVGKRLPGCPNIFLNTHPAEDLLEDVLPSLRAMRKLAPHVRVTLEIHESVITSPATMLAFQRELHDLQVSLAFDDFGAGQARLADLVKVSPDFLKFDRTLVRDLHIATAKQHQLVETLVRMVKDFGIAPLAEGIECEEEARVCEEIGFIYAQGYHFGRPAPVESFLSKA